MGCFEKGLRFREEEDPSMFLLFWGVGLDFNLVFHWRRSKFSREAHSANSVVWPVCHADVTSTIQKEKISCPWLHYPADLAMRMRRVLVTPRGGNCVLSC